MLNKIEIRNVFAHKHTVIDFNTGLTRLHGANEAGKSQVFEMVRWALFGSKALRTSVEDYKGGSVTLTFNGDYTVHRTTANATLHYKGELVARSSSAVNKKIIEIIGYGLKTFDNVNSIQQDEVTKLTKMKAEERKKFLDELIGAAQIDALTTEYRTEVAIAKAEIDALSANILNVPMPKDPGVPLLEAIEKSLDEAADRRSDLRHQENVVAVLRTEVAKVKYAPDSFPESSVEDLEATLESARQLDAASKKARIEYPEIARIFDMGARGISVDGLKDDVAAVVASRLVRKPPHTLEGIADFMEKHIQNDAHIEVQRLQAELETYTRCPGFEKEHKDTVAKINALLSDARPYSGLPSREALVDWEKQNHEYAYAQNAVEHIASPYAQAFSGHVEFDQGTYDKIVAILNTPVPDILSIYSALNAKRSAVEVETKKKQLEEEEKKLDPLALKALDDDIDGLRQARSLRQKYDAELRYYQEAMDKNEIIEQSLVSKRENHEESVKVVKALQGFKYYINTYFLPSVSRAASAMLVTMTNGKRKRLAITDKFEISVDGQSVEAMSGSTKAIINIALRFALQFVLTKNSFSVFLADEVDGSMDENRAKYLNESMGHMVEHITQVIVISHKDIVAPNNIKL